ncbi:BC1881 family protein [Clostridium tetani]
MHIKNVTTKELVEELLKRDGVKVTVAEPYENKEVKVNGPAIVITVTD